MYNLTLRAEIRKNDDYSQFLAVEEKCLIDVESFLEVARILGQIHELGEAISKENKP